MRAFSEAMVTDRPRRKDLPSCLLDISKGKHETVGRDWFSTDVGDYFAFTIGLDIRKYTFQLTRNEAERLAAQLKLFLQPTD